MEQPGRKGGAVELHESPILAPAAFMDGAGNQFLSRTGFTETQYRRVAGSHRLHEVKNTAASRTLPPNSFKVHLATDSIFQTNFFTRHLLFYVGELALRPRIL